MANYSPEKVEEVSFESTLIPHGTLVKCAVLFDKESRQTGMNAKSKNTYYGVTLEVVEGPYAGSKFFDQVAVSGDDGYFLNKGNTFIQYVLENTRKAHEVGGEAYEINSVHELNGGTIIAKVGIKAYDKKDNGGKGLANESLSYATPRPDSGSKAIYQAYIDGEQPWQTDYKPEIHVTKANGASVDSFSNSSHPNAPGNL